MRYDDFDRKLREECGLHSEKLDINYNQGDSRCWTAIIGKDDENVFVTFHVNRGNLGTKNYDVLGNRRQMVEITQRDIFDVLSNLIPLDLDSSAK